MKRIMVFGLVLGLFGMLETTLLAKGTDWTKASGVQIVLKGSRVSGATVYQNQKTSTQYMIFAPGFLEGNGVLVDLSSRDLYSVPKRSVEESEGGAVLTRKVSNLDKLKSATLKIDRGEKWIAVSIQAGGDELEVTLPKP